MYKRSRIGRREDNLDVRKTITEEELEPTGVEEILDIEAYSPNKSENIEKKIDISLAFLFLKRKKYEIYVLHIFLSVLITL